MIVFSHRDVKKPLALMSRLRFCFSSMSVSCYSLFNSTLYSVYVPILYIGSRNEYVFLLFHYLIEAIKLSTLSILTMPASSPLSASFIADSVVSFGISTSKLSVIPTIVTPFINPKILLRCSKMEGLSICKVIVVIIPISCFTLQRYVFLFERQNISLFFSV